MQQAALEFNAAKARADAGMTSAARHAEQDSPGWCEIAAAEIHRYAIAVFPAGFTIEEAAHFRRGRNGARRVRAFQ